MNKMKIGSLFAFGIGLATIVFCSGHEARAGAAGSKGVIITGTGGPVQGTDPLILYTFDVSLAPGFSFVSGDYVEFVDVPGVRPGALTGLSSPYLAGFSYPTITQTGTPSGGATPPYSPTNTYTSDVKWIYTGTTIPAGSDIGIFSIQTSVSLTGPPVSVTYYALSTDTNTDPPSSYFQGPGGNGPPGVVVLSVPEPASMVLLLTGAALPLFFIHRERQARRRKGAQ